VTASHDDGFHEISFKLGRNTEGLESLGRQFAQHCEDDDRRHVENVQLLTANNDAIGKLANALAPLLASQALTKRRLALLASGGFAILVGLSWVMESALKWAVGKLLIKFGGP
jgi:hypothetical protein